VNAAVRLELEKALPYIEGDRIQLEQVCVNLIKNACDALNATSRADRWLTLRTFAADGRVRLEVTDTGCGVGESDGMRIFDAFYSTKADGMGMGLSLCKSIAEAHNMQIGFTSNEDQPGTTFYVNMSALAAREP
jgi:signal transduction histidine kinase